MRLWIYEFIKVAKTDIVKSYDRAVEITKRKEDWIPAERVPCQRLCC
jgi:hypothetical protein